MRRTVMALALAVAFGALGAEAADTPKSGNVVRGATLRTSSSGTWLPDPTGVKPASRGRVSRPARASSAKEPRKSGKKAKGTARASGAKRGNKRTS